jgi:hypothetical protein
MSAVEGLPVGGSLSEGGGGGAAECSQKSKCVDEVLGVDDQHITKSRCASQN